MEKRVMSIEWDIDLLKRAMRKKKLRAVILEGGTPIVIYDSAWMDRQQAGRPFVSRNMWPTKRLNDLQDHFDKSIREFELRTKKAFSVTHRPEAMRSEDV